MKKAAVVLFAVLLSGGLSGCFDFLKEKEEDDLSEPSLEYDGEYEGTASQEGTQIGIWEMSIDEGFVFGYYFDGSEWIGFNGEVHTGGQLDFGLTLSEGTWVEVALQIDENGNVAGTWTDSDGETGTLSGALKGNPGGGNGNVVFVEGSGATDIDGNSYKTIILGNQEWMAENLNTATYANGDPIANLKGNTAWQNADVDGEIGAWSSYNNDSGFDEEYGKYYNWYAVNDPRNICPEGWHVPSDEEWDELILFLDESADPGVVGSQSLFAGGMMKTTGTLQEGTGKWEGSNDGATNEAGFNGLPGGSRESSGVFFDMGYNAIWWTSTEKPSNTDQSLLAWARIVTRSSGGISRHTSDKNYGFSCRCVKD